MKRNRLISLRTKQKGKSRSVPLLRQGKKGGRSRRQQKGEKGRAMVESKGKKTEAILMRRNRTESKKKDILD